MDSDIRPDDCKKCNYYVENPICEDGRTLIAPKCLCPNNCDYCELYDEREED